MKNIFDFVKLVLKYDKSLLFILLGNIIFGALQPFPKIILSKIIFDYLVDGTSLTQFLYMISILVVLDIIIQFVFYCFEQLVELKGQWLMFELSYNFNRKTMDLEYEMLLDSKILEKRELGLKVVSGSNFIDMIRSIRSIISNGIVMIGVIFIVLQVGFYVLIPVLLVVIFNSWINSRAKKVQYQCSVDVVPHQRRIGYLQSICSDFSFVKEISINDCSDLIDNKYASLSKTVYSFMKKIISKQEGAFRISSISNGLQDMVIYSILGFKVLIQKTISIGDFSMYFGAVSNFKDSVLQIMSDLVDLRMNGLNVGHFIDYMNIEDKKMDIEKSST